MTAMQSPKPLKTYLICHGAENEFWLCEAEDRDHAVEQFETAELDGDINEVFECIPAMNRYFVRQRRVRWVCFVQEIDAEDEDAAIDTFDAGFAPQHSFVEDGIPYIADGPATVFDRREYPNAREVAEAD